MKLATTAAIISSSSKFEHYPHGVIAHSTHLREWEPTMKPPALKTADQGHSATGIPVERCERIGLVTSTQPTLIQNIVRERGPGILVVPRAGEMLYRLKRNT